MHRSSLVWTVMLCLFGALFASRAAEADVSPGKAAINEALAYMDAGRYGEALESAKAAIKAEPDRVEAHLLYIQLMMQLNRRSEVEAQYAKLKEQHKGALATVLWGRTLGSLDEMEAAFRKALTIDPNLGWAHYCIASVQMQRQNPEAAIASLKEAIRIQPGFTTAIESLATLYLAMGKVDDAISTYEEVLATDPDNAKTLFQLGSILGGRGETGQAVTLLEKSMKLAPDNPQVMANLAFMYFKQERYDESIALYDKALAIVPNQSEIRLNREVVRRVKKGDLKFEAVTEMERAMDSKTPEEAMGHYRKVMEINPNFELPYLAMGQLLAATNKVAEAEKSFLKAVELNPGFDEGVRLLAEFYLVTKQPQKAEPHLLKAIELSPDAPELHAALGTVYGSTGRPVEAEQSFAKAVSLLPPASALPTRVNLAKAIASQGRFADAAKELRAILKAAPGLSAARLELGHCYFAMEEYDRAREQYKLLLKGAPDNEDLKKLIKAVDDAQADYAAKSKTQLRASHIVVKTKAEADAIVEELKAGADFERLAREKSTGPEAARGGDIGFFNKGELMPEFEKAVLALGVGEISGVVKTSSGYHVIKRTN